MLKTLEGEGRDDDYDELLPLIGECLLIEDLKQLELLLLSSHRVVSLPIIAK